MSERIYILGNGFNKDLGLKIDYQDFFKSEQWESMSNNQQNNPLIKYIKEKIIEENYNIEEILADYLRTVKDIIAIEQDKKGLYLLEEQFSSFVDSINYKNININSKAYQLLVDIQQERKKLPVMDAVYVCSFCYTLFDSLRTQKDGTLFGDIDKALNNDFSGNPLGEVEIDIDYIHGRCSRGKSKAIFGVSCDAFKSINPTIMGGYSFFLKEKHENYMPCKKKYLQDSLMRADYIHFFGFSFSNPDITYVENWLKIAPAFSEKRTIVLDVFNKRDGECIIKTMMQIAGHNWTNIISKYSILVRDSQGNEYFYL